MVDHRFLCVLTTPLLVFLMTFGPGAGAARAQTYVDSDAGGGSGTAADPYGSIQDGIDHATAGDTIVIEEGSYDEAITLDADYTIVVVEDEDGSASGVSVADGVTVEDGLMVSVSDADVPDRTPVTAVELSTTDGVFDVNGEIRVTDTAALTLTGDINLAGILDAGNHRFTSTGGGIRVDGPATLDDGPFDVDSLHVAGHDLTLATTAGGFTLNIQDYLYLGSTTVTAAEAATVNITDDAFVTRSSDVNLSSANLTINGPANSYDLRYEGDGDITIGELWFNGKVNELTIATTGTVFADTPASGSGTLTVTQLNLTGGLLVTEGDVIVQIANVTRTVEEGEDSHIVGTVAHSISGSLDFTFPVGTADGTYRPLSFSDSGVSSGTITVFHENQQPGGKAGLPTGGVEGRSPFYWSVQADGDLSSSDQTVKVSAEGYGDSGDYESASDLRIIRRNAGSESNPWQVQGAVENYVNTVAESTPTVTVTGSSGGLSSQAMLFAIGLPGTSTDSDGPRAGLPEKFKLTGNYPNPFNPTTNIQFDLPARAEVTVEIYNTLGQRILMLPPQTMQAGAARTIQVDAASLSSGSYIYRVIARSAEKQMVGSGKMTVVR